MELSLQNPADPRETARYRFRQIPISLLSLSKEIQGHDDFRRRGLARRVLDELERGAQEQGYSRVFLTTGPRQPEARELYLRAGYTAHFDLTADPETLEYLAFSKPLGPVARR